MGDRANAELEDAQCREVKAHVAKIQAERMLRRIREGEALTTKSSWHRSAGPATPGGQIMLRRSAEMRAADDAGQDSIESPDDCCCDQETCFIGESSEGDPFGELTDFGGQGCEPFQPSFRLGETTRVGAKVNRGRFSSAPSCPWEATGDVNW